MKVVGTGLACLDIINRENEIVVMNGGTCANVMTGLAQLGEEATILLPKYQEDMQRDQFYSTFKKLNVELLFYGSTKQNIPRIIETYDENFKHVFFTKCPLCNKDLIKHRFISNKESKEFINEIKDYDVFFTDRISDGIKNIAKEFNQNNAKVFYEPNSGRNLKALVEMARLSNVLKFSTDRISVSLADNILNQCQDCILELVIATHGKDGLSFCYKKDNDSFTDWITGPYVEFKKMKDTSGAGDWLTAGFLHYWNQIEFELNETSIYNVFEKSLKLSAIASMTEGAQGVFYDKVVFNLLKKEHDIKLKSLLKRYVRHYDDTRPCNACLLECDK